MKKENHYDIVIVGAGLTGLLMSLLLGSNGINVCVIEQSDYKKNFSKGLDKRTTAISQGTKRLLEKLSLWKSIKRFCQPIKKITVQEQFSKNELDFDSSKLNQGSLGFIIKNKILKTSLLNKIEGYDCIKLLLNTKVDDIKINKKNSDIKPHVRSGINKITSNLIIVSDGRFSKCRELINMKYFMYDYNQTAYIFNIKHQENHNSEALERFFPEGPLAILPMKNNSTTFFESSVVWTIENSLGDFTKLTKENFKAEFLERYNNYFGDIKHISIPKKYNLDLRYTYSSFVNRVVFIGDSSQAIHPIAGQGFNLAVRDCESLCEILLNQKYNGFDVGNTSALLKYENRRYFDRKVFIESTHRLNLLFSNNYSAIKGIRSLGLSMVQNLDFLKKELMLVAMGLKGFNSNFQS